MRKILLAISSIALLSACSVENVIQVTPVMVTYEPQSVLSTSASIGGITMSEGGSPISEYGIVISTNDAPGMSDIKVPVGEGMGDYFINYEGLSPGTGYFYRSYGINAVGTGYGETYSFTTQEEAACDPVVDNKINIGYFGMDLIIDNAYMDTEELGFNDGNIQFYTDNYNIQGVNFVVTLQFNEINRRTPLTGTYKNVYEFDGLSQLSNGEVKIYLSTVGASGSYGIPAPVDEKVYIENNDGVIRFIFCDTKINDMYTLNGTFVYTE